MPRGTAVLAAAAMISLTDTQSKRCRVPTLAGVPAVASAPPCNEWNERGVGRRPAGGREPLREDLQPAPAQVAPPPFPGDMDPPPYQVSGVTGMGLSACAQPPARLAWLGA